MTPQSLHELIVLLTRSYPHLPLERRSTLNGLRSSLKGDLMVRQLLQDYLSLFETPSQLLLPLRQNSSDLEEENTTQQLSTITHTPLNLPLLPSLLEKKELELDPPSTLDTASSSSLSLTWGPISEEAFQLVTDLQEPIKKVLKALDPANEHIINIIISGGADNFHIEIAQIEDTNE